MTCAEGKGRRRDQTDVRHTMMEQKSLAHALVCPSRRPVLPPKSQANKLLVYRSPVKPHADVRSRFRGSHSDSRPTSG